MCFFDCVIWPALKYDVMSAYATGGTPPLNTLPRFAQHVVNMSSHCALRSRLLHYDKYSHSKTSRGAERRSQCPALEADISIPRDPPSRFRFAQCTQPPALETEDRAI